MNHNHLHDSAHAAYRRERLQREAAQERFSRALQVYRPGLGARLLSAMGGWMITGGTRLRSLSGTVQPKPGRVLSPKF